MTEKFEYEFPNKTKISVPKFADALTIGFANKLRKLDEQDQMFELYEFVIDSKTRKKLENLPLIELGKFFQAWQENSGVTLGESVSSLS